MNVGQSIDHSLHGVEPRRFRQRLARADERLPKALFTVDVLESESAANAESTVSLGSFSPVAPLIFPGERGSHADDFGVFGFEMHLAAITTIVAGGGGFFHLPGLVQVLGIFVRDRADRTDSQAVSAEFTGKGLVPFRHDLVESALLHELQRVDHQHVFADVDAFRASDAAIHVEVEDETPRVFRNELLLRIGEIGHTMLEGHVLELAMPVCVADRAVQRVNREMFFDGFLSCREEVVAVSADHHTGCRLGSAGTDRGLLAFLHDQAHTAGSEGIKGIVITHGRNNLARAGNDIVQRDAIFGRYRPSVDRQFDRGRFDVWIGCWFQTHEVTSSQKRWGERMNQRRSLFPLCCIGLHRSHSPMTISYVPKIVTASAIM